MTTHQPDAPIEIEIGGLPTASVIWLHGLGADGNDFAPIVPELHLPDTLSLRFIFPHAPVRPVTCNGGYRMRAWYDIYSLENFERQDEAGLIASQQIIDALIKNENNRGIPTHRIVVMGFSQGGAVALFSGLRHPQRLAGIGALSSYLPLAESTETQRSSANQHPPIFMAHGFHDPVVRYEHGEASCAFLKNLAYDICWKTYAMEHNVCADEIADISAWLTSCFARQAD